jgi:hypothetical protein
MRRRSISILAFILSVAPVYSQEWQSDLNRYFDGVRKEINPPIPESLLAAKDDPKTLAFFSSLVSDSSYSVRAKRLELIYFVSSHSSNSSVRNRGVEMLLQPCIDGDIETAGIALDFIIKFQKTDFTPPVKDNVRKLVQRATLQYNEILKLAAFLELYDLTADIRRRSLTGNRPATRWAALLSLARMRDNDAASDIIRRVKKLPLTDDLVYRVFPDLIFTRNKSLINYMVEALMSDSKDCVAADAEREINIPCGYRIMEQLASIVDGFPLALDDTGDLQTNDYPAALQQAREWFINNTDYTILNDQY